MVPLLFCSALLLQLDAMAIPSQTRSHGETDVAVMPAGHMHKSSSQVPEAASVISQETSPKHKHSHRHAGHHLKRDIDEHTHHHKHRRHAAKHHHSHHRHSESSETGNGEQSVASSHQSSQAEAATATSSHQSQSANGQQTPGRWCATSQLQPWEIGLEATPEFMPTQVNGYCYYLSKKGQSCTDACWEQGAGRCDAMGTEFAAQTMHKCWTIAESFGLPSTVDNSAKNSYNDRSGCVWQEAGSLSSVKVMEKDDLFPYCSERHNLYNNHRVCACMPIFGNKSLFTESVGICANSGGTNGNQYKTGQYEHVGQCEDECARDSTCHAFAYVHPWDTWKRQCLFYNTGAHAGNGINTHIRCMSKEAYTATVGACSKAGGATESVGSSTAANCKSACDTASSCHAYQVDIAATSDSCTLFGPGHSGDGTMGKQCWSKASGGILA